MTLCRATVREVVGSSIPARPTLRVFKELSREYRLCNDTCEWLDSLVFLEDCRLCLTTLQCSYLYVSEPKHYLQKIGHEDPSAVVISPQQTGATLIPVV